jgi:hypothetical protein
MTPERYNELEMNIEVKLTSEERAEGWHFCDEFDSMLVGPGMQELECCTCLPVDHPVYDTAPWILTFDDECREALDEGKE